MGCLLGNQADTPCRSFWVNSGLVSWMVLGTRGSLNLKYSSSIVNEAQVTDVASVTMETCMCCRVGERLIGNKRDPL